MNPLKEKKKFHLFNRYKKLMIISYQFEYEKTKFLIDETLDNNILKKKNLIHFIFQEKNLCKNK